MRIHECNYRDFPRDFPCNGSRDTPSISIPSSKSMVQPYGVSIIYGSTNKVHVYTLQY